ncbi:DNA-binding protein [Pseudoduganella sp. RAF53_2]|uniref:DNA-binding protein n=1 Tax=unclassified Pseudoduganella TaxID=2637179 RepID=UPI003F9A1376
MQQSVLKGRLYSASEIAALALPGLPKSKPGVIARASAEGWKFETQKGIGGTKRLYEVPAKYFAGTVHARFEAARETAHVAGTVAGGTNKVDTEKLELAIRALTEWEKERNIQVSADRRPALIALLYEYLQNHLEEGPDAMQRVLRALG